jgi:hypothetical protein
MARAARRINTDSFHGQWLIACEWQVLAQAANDCVWPIADARIAKIGFTLPAVRCLSERLLCCRQIEKSNVRTQSQRVG